MSALFRIAAELLRKVDAYFKRLMGPAEANLVLFGVNRPLFDTDVTGQAERVEQNDIPPYDGLEIQSLRYHQLRRIELSQTVSRFGPLGVGIDVQGAVTLYQAARNGIRIDRQGSKLLQQRCDKLYRDSSAILHDVNGGKIQQQDEP